MGRKLVLTGTHLTDTAAPKLAAIDQIESAGSLYLIEPAHPAAPWTSGVPATASTVPNLLKDTNGTGDATIIISGGIDNGTKGKIERSSKGGLHVIVSQATALASGDGVKIVMPTALNAYLVANPTNDYYVSFWDRLTRIQVDVGSAWAVSYSTTVGNVNTSVGTASSNGWLPPTGAVELGKDNPGNALGGRYASYGIDRNANVNHVDNSAGPNWGAAPLTVANAGLASRNLKWPSFVFYRFYIEDLTVSGRTYAEVDVIDHALYTKEVLTPGGRYYGDTFTDPATIP